MDPHDQELLEFAHRWEPFGGPSTGDILVNFGMTPSRFSARLKELRYQCRSDSRESGGVVASSTPS